MKLTLIRTSMNENPTIGMLFEDNELIAITLELPWKDNAHQISCIPVGIYTCNLLENHRTSSGTVFEKCYQVLNVPEREGILIHPGNTVHDTEGCILPGQGLRLPYGFSTISGYQYVPICISESRSSLIILADRYKSRFDLEIKNGNQ